MSMFLLLSFLSYCIHAFILALLYVCFIADFFFVLQTFKTAAATDAYALICVSSYVHYKLTSLSVTMSPIPLLNENFFVSIAKLRYL